MGNFKKLYIDRDSIIRVIEEFLENECETYSVSSDFENINNNQNRLQIQYNEFEFYIDFYFNKNGTTTIGTTGGANSHMKVRVAEFIKQSEICCLTQDDVFKNSWYIIDNIECESVEDILGVVESCDENKILLESIKSEGANGPKWNLKGKYGEAVTIHYYNSKRKAMLQGKPRLLFSMLTSGFNELVEQDNIVSNFNDYFKINVEKSNVERQLACYLPNVNTAMPEKLRKTLLQSVYNLNVDGDMYDYSFLAYPIYRGLEGHLRYVFDDHSIRTGRTIGQEFIPDGSGGHQLHPSHHCLFGNCPEKIAYVGEVYNRLNAVRNRLFHWDVPTGTVDTTFMIPTIEDAKTHIVECFELIDEYYTLK